MERAGDFLGKVMRRFDRPEAAIAWLRSAWPNIAGKAVAAHTRPIRCHDSLLELATDGLPWQQQLESMRRELCDHINQAWGGNLVREVKFTLSLNAGDGRIASKESARKIPYELDNAHTPFIRRRSV